MKTSMTLVAILRRSLVFLLTRCYLFMATTHGGRYQRVNKETRSLLNCYNVEQVISLLINSILFISNDLLSFKPNSLKAISISLCSVSFELISRLNVDKSLVSSEAKSKIKSFLFRSSIFIPFLRYSY